MKKHLILFIILFLLISEVKAIGAIPFLQSGAYFHSMDGENYLTLNQVGSTGARGIDLFKEDVKVYSQAKEITQQQYEKLISYLDEYEKLRNTDYNLAIKKVDQFREEALKIGFDDTKWTEISNYKYDGDNRLFKLGKRNSSLYIEWIKIETDDFNDGSNSKYYAAGLFKNSNIANLDVKDIVNNGGTGNEIEETIKNETSANVKENIEVKKDTTVSIKEEKVVKREDKTNIKNPKTGLLNDYRFYIGLIGISLLSYMVFRKVKRIV